MIDPVVAYCWEGCGQPATHELPLGMNHGHEVIALVCEDHADGSPFTIEREDGET